MKALFTFFVLALFSFSFQQALASSTIECQTPHLTKVFTINDHAVVFKADEGKQARTIASITKIRSKKIGSSFKKILHHEGNQYTISIANEEKFDEVNDYLSIRSPEGHEMTYPISCKSL